MAQSVYGNSIADTIAVHDFDPRKSHAQAIQGIACGENRGVA